MASFGRSLIAVALSSILAPAEPPALRAALASVPVRVDGILDDAAWSTADSTDAFGQVEPSEGRPPGSRTVLRVVAEADAIVISVRCDYAPGTALVTFARDRDANLSNEDHVRIVLDTFRDGRSGYVFAVNANGARYDALVSGDREGENANWDAAWEAATSRTTSGWTAELRIPSKSLLFKKGLTAWGLNVQRRIQVLQETDRWASPSRDIKITQTSRAGVLTGVPAFDLGIGASIRPAVTAGGAHDSAGGPLRDRSHTSLDVTQRLGANTLAAVTVNTDFGETEVDTRRINLTRFPLFFPEKRTFFLEGADIFDFGVGLDDDVVPFFSRRIGLIDGSQVPINVGAKINGRLGQTNFGALTVNTRETDGRPTHSTMSVLRVKQNVLDESNVGFIATSGDPLGRPGGWLAGPDLTYRTSRFRGDKNFLIGVWGVGAGREGLRGDRTAAGFKVDYPNDLWDIAARYKRIGDGFDPSLGFVPRAGVHVADLNVNWQPRPRRPIGPFRIRQCFWENELSYVGGITGGWQSYRYFMAPINCRLESGDRFEFNFVPTGDRFAEPFEIADGVVIPAGAYHFNRFRLEAGLAPKRRLNAQATWWFGQFYDGRLNQYVLTSAWKPSSLIIAELNAERDIGVVSGGRFVEDVVGTRLRLNVSPNLQVSSFLQYADESHSIGTNSRLRWSFSPLGDLFVVYNHNLRTRDPREPASRLRFASNQLLAKIQYAFRY